MYRITGTIEGMADLLYNSHGPVVAPPKGKHASKMSDAELDTVSLERLHARDTGLVLPPGAFEKCLGEGSNRAGLKDGRRALVSLLQAIIFVEGEVTVNRDKPDYIHTVWGRVPPRTGAHVPIRRPALNAGWQAAFSMIVSQDRVTADVIREALETAGLLVGFGGWRPKYGRFKIVEWTVREGVKA